MKCDDLKDEKEGDDIHIPWLKIFLVGFIPFIFLFAGFVFMGKSMGHGDYTHLAEKVCESFGLWGIFLYVFVVDTLILPLSPDFVFPFVVGMHWYEAIPVIGLASALGGMTAYWIGRLLCKIPLINRFTGKAQAKWGRYITKFGTAFVIISGLLPLPFSTICCAAGVVKLTSRHVMPACLVRIVRFGIYFFIFRMGLSLI